MRVRFLSNYSAKGEPNYDKGAVVDLDEGLAQQLIAAGVVKAYPRSTSEVAEQAVKYYAGDDKRTPAQIADRVPQVVALAGDTRTATEEQTGEDDPHEFRKDAVAATEAVAEKKGAEKEAVDKEAERAAAEKKKAEDAASSKRGA